MARFLGVCHLSFRCRLVCLFGDGGSVFISRLTFFVISIFGVGAVVRGCSASFLWVFGIRHGGWVMCEWGGGFGSWVWVWRRCLALLDVIPPSSRWCHVHQALVIHNNSRNVGQTCAENGQKSQIIANFVKTSPIYFISFPVCV